MAPHRHGPRPQPRNRTPKGSSPQDSNSPEPAAPPTGRPADTPHKPTTTRAAPGDPRTPDPPRRKEFRPPLRHQSVGPPRQGTRRPGDRKLPQPLVHHRRRPRPRLVLEPQIIIDQDRHLVPDRRTAAQGPAFPAVGAEAVNKHSGSKAGATDSPD